MKHVSERYLKQDDLDAILKMEFEHFEYDEGGLSYQELSKILSVKNVTGRVLFIDNKLAAYIIYKVGEREIEVLRILVHNKVRRQRLATKLISYIKSKLDREIRRYLVCFAPDKHLDLHLFLADNHFKAFVVVEDKYRFEFKLE